MAATASQPAKVEVLALYLSTPFSIDGLVGEFGFDRFTVGRLLLVLATKGYVQSVPNFKGWEVTRSGDVQDVALLMIRADTEARLT